MREEGILSFYWHVCRDYKTVQTGRTNAGSPSSVRDICGEIWGKGGQLRPSNWSGPFEVAKPLSKASRQAPITAGPEGSLGNSAPPSVTSHIRPLRSAGEDPPIIADSGRSGIRFFFADLFAACLFLRGRSGSPGQNADIGNTVWGVEPSLPDIFQPLLTRSIAVYNRGSLRSQPTPTILTDLCNISRHFCRRKDNTVIQLSDRGTALYGRIPVLVGTRLVENPIELK